MLKIEFWVIRARIWALMKRFFLSLLGLLTVCSCASRPGEDGAPLSLIRSFIDRPEGSQIQYRDEDTAHVITLHENGTYLFESMGIYDGTVESRNGTWGWKKVGTHHAELTLDKNRWNLTFSSHESALATNEAWPNTFAFQFQR